MNSLIIDSVLTAYVKEENGPALCNSFYLALSLLNANWRSCVSICNNSGFSKKGKHLLR